jgi:hypothetical protein
MIETKNEN